MRVHCFDSTFTETIRTSLNTRMFFVRSLLATMIELLRLKYFEGRVPSLVEPDVSDLQSDPVFVSGQQLSLAVAVLNFSICSLFLTLLYAL